MGVISSYSRPHVSNDNPFSEALFRTLKYCPLWPSTGFKSIDDARKWVAKFVDWYNALIGTAKLVLLHLHKSIVVEISPLWRNLSLYMRGPRIKNN
ncbi:TPA: transposase [Legionella pneumophila]|nr:transposase [Legionella pneumophila]HAT7910059.1 transposase [Legionella pneumophila]HAT7913556.1 transposase [Legionella pneumophila]HAT7916637.1 transposase [Legionella pneumophila]HAT7983359.1 transposase [Legionella pneumophila]